MKENEPPRQGRQGFGVGRAALIEQFDYPKYSDLHRFDCALSNVSVTSSSASYR